MAPPVVAELRGLISLRAAVFHGHFASGAKSGHGLAFGYEFHGYTPIKAQLAELAEDIWIVYLAGTGIVATRHISDMHNTDQIEILFQLGKQVAFGDLVVKKIIEKLNVGSADGANNLKTFGNRSQEIFRIFFG